MQERTNTHKEDRTYKRGRTITKDRVTQEKTGQYLYVLSCIVFPFLVLSCPLLLSGPFLNCLVLSCPLLNCSVLSYAVWFFLVLLSRKDRKTQQRPGFSRQYKRWQDEHQKGLDNIREDKERTGQHKKGLGNTQRTWEHKRGQDNTQQEKRWQGNSRDRVILPLLCYPVQERQYKEGQDNTRKGRTIQGRIRGHKRE
jgi:hypothetical protein